MKIQQILDEANKASREYAAELSKKNITLKVVTRVNLGDKPVKN